ncbi:hypothetical protein Hypma_002942 [Hypsizygus marmoreus]|uniref:Uncharacterized protein n=1 Tax=Hypsizygus marmoreus TaxID=39966 RepID=A0A369J9F3_HYPMA|nr:hypothetical protein Hypma_002942 [Hypsizygus marmoreus]
MKYLPLWREIQISQLRVAWDNTDWHINEELEGKCFQAWRLYHTAEIAMQVFCKIVPPEACRRLARLQIPYKQGS